MPALSTYPKQEIVITFPVTMIERAKKKAKRELGIDFPKLLRYLVANYLANKPLRQEQWYDRCIRR